MASRELIGIGMFAVALAITLSLTFRDDGQASDRVPPTISSGLTPPTLTATPTATATPVPIHALGDPDGSWLISYYSFDAEGGRLPELELAYETLDLSFANAPIPDIRDNDWSLEAHGSFERVAGRYRVSIETSGDMDMRVDGRIVEVVGVIDGTVTREVVIDHGGGTMAVVVTAEDRLGEFRLAVGPGAD